MAMANGHLGPVNFGGCGVLLPGLLPNPSSATEFLILRKPICGLPLNWALVRKTCVFDARRANRRVVGSLASGEVGACSSELRHIEKELTFSPTFTDYVKIMESVKVDRSKGSWDGDSDGRSSKRRLTGNGAASGVGGGRKLGGLKKKSFGRKSGYHDESGSEKGMRLSSGKSNKQKNVGMLVKKRVPDHGESSRGELGQVGELSHQRKLPYEDSDVGGIVEKKQQGQFVSHVKKRDSRANIVDRQSGRETTVHLNGLEDSQEHEIFTDFGKYSSSKNSSVWRNTKSIIRIEKGCTNNPRGSVNEHGVTYVNHKNLHHSKGKADSKFQRSEQSIKPPGRKIAADSAEKDEREHDVTTISRRCGDVQRIPEHDSYLSHVNARRYGDLQRMNEHGIAYVNDKNLYHSKGKADSKFQRSEQSMEPLRRKIAVDEAEKDERKHAITTLSRQYDDLQRIPRNDSHLSHANASSVQPGRHEAISLCRKTNIQSHKFATSYVNSTDIDNRAAFKTFEKFTDVRNRPRVLRMEMEERIQKLASKLNATDVNSPEWQFSKMIHAAKIRFSDHSVLRIVQILGQFGNWKCVLQVVEWLRSRERFKSYKSRYIYTTVLDVLGKAKRPFEALNIFYTMLEQLSSYPDIAAYHCIAVTLGQAGLMKELFDVIDCMRSPPKKKFKLGPLQKWDPRLEPDLTVYNAVLNSCVQQQQWEGAFWVLQQLKEHNIRPTNTTYGLVMEVMLACGKYNLVYEFFKKVEKSAIPDALNYKVLVNSLWREGKIDEAVLAVKDMEKRGIVGSASLYYDLARCLCSGGRFKEALLKIEKICKVANKPLVVTYTGLIQTCVDHGSMDSAKYIFNEMRNFCLPNTVTCNIMLKSYIQHGMFEDAKNLFVNILKGNIRSRVDLSKSAVADKFTFNTFMKACVEAKNWDDFEYAYREMLSKGYHFDARRHLRMVLDAFRDGKEHLLEATWEYFCFYGRVPPAPIIMERFCLKLREGNITAAISCIKIFQDSEIRNISSTSWSSLLTRNTDRLVAADIVKLVLELNSIVGSSNPSDSLYHNILSSCIQFLSDATASEKASSDQQSLLCNL